MAVYTVAASEHIAEWIRQRSLALSLSAEQTISAILEEGMDRSAALSELETDLFKALENYGARPGIGIAAETLRFHWLMKVSRSSSNEMAVAVEALVSRGFVVANDGAVSAPIYLTDAGAERMISLGLGGLSSRREAEALDPAPASAK